MSTEKIKIDQFNFAAKEIETLLNKLKIKKQDAVLHGFNCLTEVGIEKNSLGIISSPYPDSIQKASGRISIYGIFSICLAAAHLELAEKYKHKDELAFKFLQYAILYSGSAYGCLHEVAISCEFDRIHKKKIGNKGLQTKHKPTDTLKEWALKQASGLKGEDLVIANKLSARLPSNLADVSKNPKQLIYRALLARSKAKKIPLAR